ncbi:MAG: HupE/UreJ family protein [Pseudomonadota bacterium]
MNRTLRHLLAGATLLTIAGTVSAHSDHGTASFASGFVHPLAGLDHLLAMVAVGLWSAAALPVRRRLIGPSLFVALLAAGAALSAAVPALRFIEPGIALSVVLLGALLLGGRHIDVRVGLALIAGAALLHGYAHGAEMASASFATYAAGFALASALLHGLGFALGAWTQKTQAWVWRAAAAGTAISGAAMLVTRL